MVLLLICLLPVAGIVGFVMGFHLGLLIGRMEADGQLPVRRPMPPQASEESPCPSNDRTSVITGASS